MRDDFFKGWDHKYDRNPHEVPVKTPKGVKSIGDGYQGDIVDTLEKKAKRKGLRNPYKVKKFLENKRVEEEEE